jgi:hypothetical protein
MLLLWATLANADEPPTRATAIAGVEWAPLGRADLTWIDEARTSGVAVGEYDGVVRPNLQGYAGVWWPRWGVVGRLGVAVLQSTTWSGDVVRARHWGVVRPELGVRYGFGDRTKQRPRPWLELSGHGDIPTTADVSNGYTDSEQEMASEVAYADRLRLGGFGFALTAGADQRVVGGLSVGASAGFESHFGVIRSGDTQAVSALLAPRATLRASFEWW